MTAHEELLKLLHERYEPGENAGYAEKTDFLFISLAPEQYSVEEEILEYAKARPDAACKDLLRFLLEIVPEGLPPGTEDGGEED